MFSVSFLHLKQYDFILNIAHKISYYIIIFLKLFGEKRFAYSVNVFRAGIKSIKPKQISTHYWMICLYSGNICFNVFIVNKCFNFFSNLFYTKRIKINNIIIIILHTQSNPMSSNIRILIEIYYISPILYFGYIISRKNTIKSWFIFIIF